MSKLTATGSVMKALDTYKVDIRIGHDQHGFGKIIFVAFGNKMPRPEPDPVVVIPPASERGQAILACLRPAKQGSDKPKPDATRRLIRQGTRLLKAAARLEGLLDEDRRQISFV